MATAEEGGATDITTETMTNASYGGGTGGKFRKKPLRRQTTPYDRPSTSLRPKTGNSNSSSNVGWLKNLVVDQAFKLFSYGANRLFGSSLRKQLPQAPDVNHDVGEEFLESVPNEELVVANSSQPMDSSNSNGISELEKLLKRNTFTRPEVLHLTELLHSRAVEAASADESKKMETPSVFGRYDENRNEGVRSHGATTSTPILNLRVHEEDIGSPAELAKAYMGNRPSKLSPSMLGMNRRVDREDTGLVNNIPVISNSPILPLTRKSSSIGAAENCFITPRSRGRSALYNMARTPYSRVYPASIMKGGGNNNNDFGSSMPSTPIAVTEHGEKIESKSTNLKRRSSYLDDEVGSGSVGPIRRIRQKQNLLVPRVPHSARGVGIGSAKQKLTLIEANHDRNANGSVASTSYASVPSRSSEVASKILQHLEKLSPKEKSHGSKLVAVMDKSPFKSTPGVLHGQARRSMEDVGTSKFMLNGKDDSNMEDMSNTNLPDPRESTSQNQEKVGETGGNKSVAPLDLWSSAKKNDESVMPLKVGTSDFLVRNNASQHSQKTRAFTMNGQEGGDVQYNGIAPIPLSEKKGPIEENNLSTAEDLKSLKTTIQPEVKLTSGFVFSKTSEFGAPSSEYTGEGSNGIALPASEETITASQSAVFPPPATVFDKPKDNPPPLFAFSYNAGDKFQPLTSESSSKNPEPKLDGASSFSNISAPNGFQSKSPESEKDLDHHKAADKIRKSDTAPPASNGLFGTGTSTTFSGITFKSALAPATTTSAGPVFKLGSSADPSPSASAPSATEISQVTDSKTKSVENQSFGGSNPIVSPFSSSNTGNDIFGLASSTPNNFQGSLFNTAKSNVSGDEPVPPQGSSAQPVSFTTNSSNAFGSSFSSSLPFNSNFITPVSGSTSTLAKLGASSSTALDNNAVTSNSNSSPFSFGLSSSSPSTNAIGSGTSATSSPFIFGGSSPTPASAANTSSSFSNGASGIFNFGGSSSTSSSAPTNSITSSSSTPSNVFGSSIFGSTFNSSNPSTGFAFNSSSTPSAPTNTAQPIFSSQSQSPIFPFGAASAPAISTPSIFGNTNSDFGASPGKNNDQMDAEDSMAEDPVQSSTPIFGQPAVSPSPPGFMFRQAPPSQANPFQSGGQTSQVAPNPFQASSSLEFNAGGSGFSLGSGGGGGDKSTRRIVRVNKNKNRKK